MLMAPTSHVLTLSVLSPAMMISDSPFVCVQVGNECNAVLLLLRLRELQLDSGGGVSFLKATGWMFYRGL